MKIHKTGQEARQLLKNGVDTVANCIKVTLGPSGRNVVIGARGFLPKITNDGVTVAHNIECENEFEEEGAKLVKEVAALTDKEVGDGTTTATVLLQAILDEAFKRLSPKGLLDNKVDTIKIKKEIDEARDEAIGHLKALSKSITLDDVYNVALVSVEYPEYASIIKDIYTIIGEHAEIVLEEGGYKTEYEIVKGMEITSGFHSEYFINNDNKQCVLENPYILVTNQVIDSPHVIEVIRKVAEIKTSLVIIAHDFSKNFLAQCIQTKLTHNMVVLPIKVPAIKNDTQLDICALTGSKLFDRELPEAILEAKIEDLGKAGKLVATMDKSTIIDGRGDSSLRVKELRESYKASKSEFDKDILEKRIAGLVGGIAIIRVGAESDTEREYAKLKIEDAINAVKNAFDSGVVKGGGLALKEVSEKVNSILKVPLTTPYEQIQKNAGGLEIGENVVDAYKTVVAGLKKACSIAGMIITTEVLTVDKNVKEKNSNED